MKKIWNISLITLSIIVKEKTTFEIFLTKRKLIKCNFFHSYKLLTLFSLYLFQWQLNKHTQVIAVYRYTIHRNSSTPVKKKMGKRRCVIPDRNCINAYKVGHLSHWYIYQHYYAGRHVFFKGFPLSNKMLKHNRYIELMVNAYRYLF